MFASDEILSFNFQQKEFLSLQKKKARYKNMLFACLLVFKKKKVKIFFFTEKLVYLDGWSKNGKYGRMKTKGKIQKFP